MKPLIVHTLFIFHLIWDDEATAKRWLVGAGGFIVTLVGMVFVNGVSEAFTWTGKQWAEKVVGALIAMIFAMVNPTGKLSKVKP